MRVWAGDACGRPGAWGRRRPSLTGREALSPVLVVLVVLVPVWLPSAGGVPWARVRVWCFRWRLGYCWVAYVALAVRGRVPDVP